MALRSTALRPRLQLARQLTERTAMPDASASAVTASARREPARGSALGSASSRQLRQTKTTTPDAVSSCAFPPANEDVAEISKPYRSRAKSNSSGCGYRKRYAHRHRPAVRRYRLTGAPRPVDVFPEAAGLLACGSMSARTPPSRTVSLVQWLYGAGLPLTVAGAATE